MERQGHLKGLTYRKILKFGKRKKLLGYTMDRVDLVTGRRFSIHCSNKIQNIISLLIKVYVFDCIIDHKRTYLLLAVL